MKHILLFGAGKSASVLIDYLKQLAAARNWRVTVADKDLEAVQSKVGENDRVTAVGVSIESENERMALIKEADVVISLLPPSLHYWVAVDCLAIGKHLLTASYVDEKIRNLSADIKHKGLLFLCEMGLDPGIDHMSAMQLIHRIKEKGGYIHRFLSHCGGLVAPESDNNPWHYKISWNPRNVVLAGKAGAVYREKSEVRSQKYENIFSDCGEITVTGLGKLAYYPNRDSLGYIPVYGLEDSETFIRTTLRHPDFCKGWNLLVQAGLTDEMDTLDTKDLPVAQFLQKNIGHNNPALHNELLKKQLLYLGWEDDTMINQGSCSKADIMQWILERKWALSPQDKDMIVMMHEIRYEVNNQQSEVKSTLVVKGEDSLRTAMAKTVGLPLGIAAGLLLDGKIKETGLHIPIIPGIYEPVLSALAEQGIVFREAHE